jgi:RNA polymerase sigma-70 factor, ECF subfamily
MTTPPRPASPVSDHGEGNSAPASDAQGALHDVFPVVYAELRQLAARYLQRERPDHTLQPTALVHEAFLRLTEQPGMVWRNRGHVLGVAATMMRRILVNHAEAHRASKRGGDTLVLLDASALGDAEPAAVGSADATVDILALDEALTALATVDPRAARVVELRFFAGLNVQDTAEVLEISSSTVKREWTVARTWLRREIAKEA